MDLSDFVLRYDLNGMTVDAGNCVDGVLIDPTDAPDSHTPNEDRPAAALMAWWRRPYITTPDTEGGHYVVHCLDGGAWDRPTMIGYKPTLAEAVEIAKAYRAEAHALHVYAG